MGDSFLLGSWFVDFAVRYPLPEIWDEVPEKFSSNRGLPACAQGSGVAGANSADGAADTTICTVRGQRRALSLSSTLLLYRGMRLSGAHAREASVLVWAWVLVLPAPRRHRYRGDH
jgi:hypothetical protein